LAYELKFLRCCGLLRHGAVLGCCVLLRESCDLLRRSMQHCGVKLVPNAEEFCCIDTVLGIEGKPSGLHGPLDRRASNITGTCSFAEGELGHATALLSGSGVAAVLVVFHLRFQRLHGMHVGRVEMAKLRHDQFAHIV
jgi:hypothetical protein